MDRYGLGSKFQIVTILLVISSTFEITAIATSIRPPNLSLHLKDSHYRFHYLVNEKANNYKMNREYRNGGNLTGPSVVAEPNNDSTIINFTANTPNAFKPNTNIQSGATPIKSGAYVTNTIATTSFGGSYNKHYRPGIFPTKNHKPLRGLNPIVVKSLPLPSRLFNPSSEHLQPYTFYTGNNESAHGHPEDTRINAMSSMSSNTTAAERNQIGLSASQTHDLKSTSATTVADAVTIPPLLNSNTNSKSYNLQSLSYLEQGIKSTNNAAMTTETLSFAPSSSNLNQFHKMDIPSSILEILNQNKGHVYSDSVSTSINSASGAPFSDIGMLKASTGTEKSIKIDTFRNAENRSGDSLMAAKDNIPQRPMRLIGLNPVYVSDGLLLQTTGQTIMSPPQIHVDPMSMIHYTAPTPGHQGPLPYSPPMPFRNIPRSSVNELNTEMPLISALPLMNSVSVSAPILPQPIATTDLKLDSKFENKPMPSPFMLCNDCLLPSNYVTYPLVRIPTAASPSLPASASAPLMTSAAAPLAPLPPAPMFNDNMNNQKSPCPSNAAAASMPMWASYPPSFAYVLLPTPMIKNKISGTPNIFS